jgi:hypothetical protein
MSETVVAASSPAEVDVFNGEQPSLAEYTQYRQSGEIPERFKPPAETVAESAPAEEIPEGEEPESEPESEPDEPQETRGKKGKTAEDRIAQLEATIEKIKRGARLERKTEVAPVTQQQAPPQNYGEWRKDFKPSQWIEDFGKKNPEASYEDATAAMADFLGDVRDQFRSIEQVRQSQAKELNDKVADARARYGEQFDEVLQPTVNAIVNDAQIPAAIKQRINRSDVLPDLMFTIGGDTDELIKFVQMAKADPDAARDHIVLLEHFIKAELAKPAEETPRGDDGKFKTAAPPAKPKTSAPKPPSPVSGVSTGAFDVSDESLSPEEWMRKRNADLARKG